MLTSSLPYFSHQRRKSRRVCLWLCPLWMGANQKWHSDSMRGSVPVGRRSEVQQQIHQDMTHLRGDQPIAFPLALAIAPTRSNDSACGKDLSIGTCMQYFQLRIYDIADKRWRGHVLSTGQSMLRYSGTMAVSGGGPVSSPWPASRAREHLPSI